MPIDIVNELLKRKAAADIQADYEAGKTYEQQLREIAPKLFEKKKSAFDGFGFYSVPDLTEDEVKPPEFVVDGMIPCGLSFLSGAPKIRKSFLALQLAAAVATGQSFLGHTTMQCDVAYLDLEGSKSRISYRAERMTIPVPHNVFVSNSTKKRLANGLVEDLRQLHRERPTIRLIIIDTFSRARGRVATGGANAYDCDVALLEPLQRMALDENIAVLCVHHDKKGAGLASDSFERLSGTMGISGSCDSVLNLIADGKRFEGRATLEFTPRDARGGELKLQFDERFGEWQEIIEPTADLMGNPICRWLVENAPAKRKEGNFISYEDVFLQSYHFLNDAPGDKVREQLEPRRDDLFHGYGLGVQLGVQSNGKRGIRVINLA